MSTDYQGHQPAPAAPAKNTMSIVGFILAFIAPPIGFILSIIGLSKAKALQAGKGLAIAGIIISILTCGAYGAATAAVFFVADKVATALDPGCQDGIDAINAVDTSSGEPEQVKAALQTGIDGMEKAIADSKDSKVKDALKAMVDDYKKMIEAINAGDTAAATELETKESTDLDRLNELCTGSK